MECKTANPRILLDREKIYAYISTFSNGLNSPLSPIIIKPQSKILIHEVYESHDLKNKVVALVTDNGKLYVCHLVNCNEFGFVLKQYNPELKKTVPFAAVQKIFVVDDAVPQEDFINLIMQN